MGLFGLQQTNYRSELRKLRTLSVVGLGKLGLCLAAVLASKGYVVIGIDKDPERVRVVNRHKSPFYEPLLEKLLQRNGRRLEATQDFDDAVDKSEATFIVVNTPSEPDGSFSTIYLKEAASKIGQALRRKRSYHLVIVTSTVLPNDTRTVVKAALETASGKKCGKDFGLCYNPEFIALGDVVRGLTRPDFVLIGEYDVKSGSLTETLYRKICENDPPIARMTIENAEVAKIALNSYITMKISFANTLAELSERVPGGDVDKVSQALGLDRRIGGLYLKGGLGFGGPCFPRDNRAFGAVAKRLGSQALLAAAVDEVNESQNDRLVSLVRSGVPNGGKVAILGVTYKPNTDVVEASPSVELANRLARQGYVVSLYDPVGLENAKKVLGNELQYAASIKDCLSGADACILATPWDAFRCLNLRSILRPMRGSLVIDCWRLLVPSIKGKDGGLTRIGMAADAFSIGSGT